MPLHRQMYLVLRDQITNGALSPGDSLPSEESLGEDFSVSRITVRRALQDLDADGYIVRRHGRGTYVAAHEPATSTRDTRLLRASLARVQAETEATVIDLGERLAPWRVRHDLGLPDGSRALYVLRVRSHDGQPLMITEAWVPLGFAAAVTAEALRDRALYELLEASGATLGRFAQEISAEVADPLRARLLGVDIGSALLRIDRIVQTSEQHPLMRNSITVDPRRSRIISDVAASDIDTPATGTLVHSNPVR
jgi:GntR family transcriptional regulator